MRPHEVGARNVNCLLSSHSLDCSLEHPVWWQGGSLLTQRRWPGFLYHLLLNNPAAAESINQWSSPSWGRTLAAGSGGSSPPSSTRWKNTVHLDLFCSLFMENNDVICSWFFFFQSPSVCCFFWHNYLQHFRFSRSARHEDSIPAVLYHGKRQCDSFRRWFWRITNCSHPACLFLINGWNQLNLNGITEIHWVLLQQSTTNWRISKPVASVFKGKNRQDPVFAKSDQTQKKPPGANNFFFQWIVFDVRTHLFWPLVVEHWKKFIPHLKKWMSRKEWARMAVRSHTQEQQVKPRNVFVSKSVLQLLFVQRCSLFNCTRKKRMFTVWPGKILLQK